MYKVCPVHCQLQFKNVVKQIFVKFNKLETLANYKGKILTNTAKTCGKCRRKCTTYISTSIDVFNSC